jgi:Domain of unknown function (DUF4158)
VWIPDHFLCQLTDCSGRSDGTARRSQPARLRGSLRTVRFLGTFLSRPPAVPGEAVPYVAEQPRIADPSCFARYGERLPTQHEHAREIRTEYVYRGFSKATEKLRAFLTARAWDHE